MFRDISQQVYCQSVGTGSTNFAVIEQRDPTPNDIYYPLGKFWVNQLDRKLWYLNSQNNISSPLNPTGNLQSLWLFLSGSINPLLDIIVDASTAPGTNPVLPDINGTVTITGGQVAAGTTINVIRTDSLSPNTFTIEIQRSQAVAVSTIGDNGVSHFDSAQFTVDANGFVQLAGGGGSAVQSLTGDDALPVVPTAGNINLTGVTVVNATNVKPVFFKKNAVSIEELDVQLTTTSTNAAKNINNAGLASFDSDLFTVDSGTGFVSLTAPTSGQLQNLGISNTAGTLFTVFSANGTALSSSNPAFVTLQNLNPAGQLVTYKITANQTFSQADIATNNFGLTNGVANATDLPFFLYGVGNARSGVNPQTIMTFMVSRFPNTVVSPIAGKIAKAGSAVANSQGSFFALDSTITVADYATSPCVCLGSFRMTWLNTNNWVITAFDQLDGIGTFQENRRFDLSPGQFGAAAGKFFKDNGGTAPQFTTNLFDWNIQRNNQLTFYATISAVTVNGVGAVPLLFALPYECHGNAAGSYFTQINGPTFITGTNQISTPSNNNNLQFAFNGSLTPLNNQDMATANNFIDPFVFAPISFQ